MKLGARQPLCIAKVLTHLMHALTSNSSIFAGTIDEKIYQRQLMKGELADAMEARTDVGAAFTREELRELFCAPSLDVVCDTASIMQHSKGCSAWQVRLESSPSHAHHMFCRCQSLSAAGCA